METVLSHSVVPVLGAVIVDDDALSRRRIRELLAERQDVIVAAECATPAEAVEAIGALKPDVVFLDVEMPRGSGFSVIEAVGEDERPAVVFVTAHEQYAIDAFAVQAVDYLLKPFDSERFEHSVQRARAHAVTRSLARARIADALLPIRKTIADRIAIRSGAGISFVRQNEIDWVETAGNYVRLHIAGESHLLRETMAAFEERLDAKRFVRTHRSAVVNVDRIRQLVPSVGREYLIVLRDGTRVKLGPQYRDNLRRLGFVF